MHFLPSCLRLLFFRPFNFYSRFLCVFWDLSFTHPPTLPYCPHSIRFRPSLSQIFLFQCNCFLSLSLSLSLSLCVASVLVEGRASPTFALKSEASASPHHSPRQQQQQQPPPRKMAPPARPHPQLQTEAKSPGVEWERLADRVTNVFPSLHIDHSKRS